MDLGKLLVGAAVLALLVALRGKARTAFILLVGMTLLVRLAYLAVR